MTATPREPTTSEPTAANLAAPALHGRRAPAFVDRVRASWHTAQIWNDWAVEKLPRPAEVMR